MSQNFLVNAPFHLLLTTIDQELADDTLKRGCPYCKGKLHRADYPRSPLGMPSAFRHLYDERLSFCCDTCRKRTTPESVRFFGRRWYPAPLFILISLLTLSINERRLAQVKKHFGFIASESTWKRWRRWWRGSFWASLFWQGAKGLVPPVLESHPSLPRTLLRVFKGTVEEKIGFLLRFLAPLTGGVLRAV